MQVELDALVNSVYRLWVLALPRYEQLHMLNQVMQQPGSMYVALKRVMPDDQLLIAVNQLLEAASLSPEARIFVVLDDAEYLTQAEARVVLLHYLQRQPRLYLILLGRGCPWGVLRDPALRPFVGWHFGAVADLLLGALPHHPDKTIVLEVNALNSTGYVRVDGQLVQDWEGELPYVLLLYLVHCGRVSRDVLLATFWKTALPARAVNSLHVALSRLHHILGTACIQQRAGVYTIAPHVCVLYDVAYFEQALHAKTTNDAERAAWIERALQVYRSPYLSAQSAPWMLPIRAQLAAQWRVASLLLVQHDLAAGQYARAIYWGQRLVRSALRNTEYVTLLMRVFMANRQPEEVLYLLWQYEATPEAAPTADMLQLAAEAQRQAKLG